MLTVLKVPLVKQSRRRLVDRIGSQVVYQDATSNIVVILLVRRMQPLCVGQTQRHRHTPTMNRLSGLLGFQVHTLFAPCACESKPKTTWRCRVELTLKLFEVLRCGPVVAEGSEGKRRLQEMSMAHLQRRDRMEDRAPKERRLLR